MRLQRYRKLLIVLIVVIAGVVVPEKALDVVRVLTGGSF